jgi:hypothetical protein
MPTALSDLFGFPAAAALGVSAGAMLTGGVVLVPYWRASVPAEFLAWFGANSQRMVSFYGPLQLLSAFLAIAAAIASIRAGAPDRVPAAVSAILAIAVFVPYFLYFQQANASFASSTIETADVPAELARYALRQWVRIGLGLAAFGASLLALRKAA